MKECLIASARGTVVPVRLPFPAMGKGGHEEGKTMWDVGCVAMSLLFFAIAIAYVAGCERLVAKGRSR